MKSMRIGTIWLLIVGLSTPALAGDLRESLAKATHEQTPSARGSMPKAYLWTGTTLFVGGMAVGLYGFLNNKNGKFPEFGEANSTDRVLGTAGLVTAFVGGTVLLLGGRRANQSTAVTVGPGRMTVAKTVRWK